MVREMIRSSVGRHQLLAFTVLTYAVSWLIWWGMAMRQMSIATTAGGVLNVVATAGPSIAAVIVAAILGRSALRKMVDGFSRARVSLRWVLVALLLPQVLIVIAIAVSVVAFGAPIPVVTVAVVGSLGREFVRVLFLGGPLEEELGWRGFALPRLQAQRTALDAALALGLIWGLWHIPLYFVPGTGQYETAREATSLGFTIGAFVVWTIGLSILFTWLYNETNGSLIVAILFHASVNLGSFVPAAVGSTGAASTLYAIATWVVAVLVIARWGKASLASKPVTAVPPSPSR
jgi:membrane protease YdiL (CAAX protease family)